MGKGTTVLPVRQRILRGGYGTGQSDAGTAGPGSCLACSVTCPNSRDAPGHLIRIRPCLVSHAAGGEPVTNPYVCSVTWGSKRSPSGHQLPPASDRAALGRAALSGPPPPRQPPGRLLGHNLPRRAALTRPRDQRRHDPGQPEHGAPGGRGADLDSARPGRRAHRARAVAGAIPAPA
jgi:hypothetical protein